MTTGGRSFGLRDDPTAPTSHRCWRHDQQGRRSGPMWQDTSMTGPTFNTVRPGPTVPSGAEHGMLAALGRFVFRRRRLVLVAWAILFAVGIVVGGTVFDHLKDSNGAGSSESVQGAQILDDASSTSATVVAVVNGRAVSDPATRAAVVRASQSVSALPHVVDVVNAYNASDPRLRATNGRASLIVITLHDSTDMVRVHDDVAAVRKTLHDAVPGASVKVGGQLAAMTDQNDATQKDLVKGELIALPILLLALFLVFRGWRSALMPVISALVTVSGALLILLAVTKIVDVGGYAIDVVALFGIALAVDYSLLIVSRFREERAADADSDLGTTVSRTIATAGRTISFSAMIVIASLAGLFAFSDPTFTSLAIGGIATVLVALAAGLTLVPALLGSWGRKIKPAVHSVVDEGFFGTLARRVQRHPIIVAVAVAAILLGAAVPFLGAVFSNGDPRTLPTSFESRAVNDLLAADFPGTQANPIQVVARTPASDPRVAAYAEQVRQVPGVAGVAIEQGLTGNVSAIDVTPTGTSQDATAQRVVRDLRANPPAYRTYVTGTAAFLIDFEHQIVQRLPYALLLIALVTFMLLFLMTGSVLVPIKALIMNALSLGATFGALVWIFQNGHLSGLLGFTAFGAIEVWVPVVVFVFAFGLSMDYEVFLLSRIKECHDEGCDSDTAVAHGLQRSGRIITSAAALVMIVFLGFAAGSSLGIKEMGLALAIAVVVDATLVRCLLVPATMTLLGNANWWAPAPLRRTYERFGLREAPVVDAPAVPAAAPPDPAPVG
jgi:RND superfamily putative drug exporter